MINFQQYSPRAKNKNWFTYSSKIQEGKKIGEIEILDYIDPFYGVSDKELINQLNKFNADKVDRIVVTINSGGGDVFAGYAIYNALLASQAPVTVIVMGLAASIASVIAMAGEEILMHEASNLMIHSPWSVVAGNADDMIATAQVLQKLETQIISIYAKKFNVDKIQIERLVKAETWFSSAEAIEIGAITQVIKAEEAKTIMASTFDLSIYKNVPKDLLSENVDDRLMVAKAEQDLLDKTNIVNEAIKEIETEEEEKRKLYQRRLDLALRECEI